jgi:hypothetical protein
MEKLDEWSKKFENWITDNYNNPILWVGILAFGILLFKVLYDGLNKKQQ